MQRHPYEWPILAENHWPNHGRKLTQRIPDVVYWSLKYVQNVREDGGEGPILKGDDET